MKPLSKSNQDILNSDDIDQSLKEKVNSLLNTSYANMDLITGHLLLLRKFKFKQDFDSYEGYHPACINDYRFIWKERRFFNWITDFPLQQIKVRIVRYPLMNEQSVHPDLYRMIVTHYDGLQYKELMDGLVDINSIYNIYGINIEHYFARAAFQGKDFTNNMRLAVINKHG